MLVTCPECGAKISDKADPCPKCGLPDAGDTSKEVAENFAQALRDMKDGEARFSLARERCDNCGSLGIGDLLAGVVAGWIKSKPIEVKVEKRGTGYTTRCYFRCPKCGGKVEGAFARWIT